LHVGLSKRVLAVAGLGFLSFVDFSQRPHFEVG